MREIRLLGTPKVESTDGDVPRFRSQRTVALLGYLVAERRTITRDRLAALFWPDEDPSKGKANLRRELHNLAQILPGCWQTNRVEVEFVPGEDTAVDIYQFQGYEAAQQWQKAADLIGGNFLEGIILADNLEFETWLLGEQERWGQRCTTILSRLMTQNITHGHYKEAIIKGRRLLQLTPWNEETNRQVILLLAWTGERTEALKQFAICRKQLRDHLAVEPEMATQTLYQTILETEDEANLKERLSAELTRLQPPHNLPQPVTRFIGRSDVLATLQERLSQPKIRLLTLTGPGGIGKTRLALEAAHSNLYNYRHGAFFVDLASLNDPTLVGAKIAEDLQLKTHANEPVLDQLQKFLHDKQMLLILDNFEQLLPAVPLVSTLLKSAPGLTVLVTSRTLLRLSGEWNFPVEPLILPVEGERPSTEQLMANEAVRLFSERARSVKSDFELTAENVTGVAEICIRLDGLPLAIELVAARSRLLSPPQILAQWGSGLHLNSRGAKDLPDRQQTLQATIDWSYTLLEAEEQTLFRQLAAFVGGFTLEAAEAVCSLPGNLSVLEGLESLLDNNMIRGSDNRDEPRFYMLISIREYALNLFRNCREEQEIQQRHAHYFMTVAETAQSNYYNKQQVTWLNILENEQDNLRAALTWSLENELEVNLRLTGALGRFWYMKGHLQEGRNWLRQALSNEGTVNYPYLKAKALNEYGLLALFLGDNQAARLNLSQSVNLWRKLDDKNALACALCDLASSQQDDLPTALSNIEESIDIFKRLEDSQGLARSFFWHGHITYLQKDYAIAQSSAQACIHISREIGDTSNLAGGISTLGRIAFQQWHFDEAERYFENSKNLFRQADDIVGIVIVLACQGLLAYVQKDYERAISYSEETLEICQKIYDRFGIAEANYLLGMTAYHQKDLYRAKYNLAESLRQYYQLDDDLGIAHSLFGLATVAKTDHQPEYAAKLIGTATAKLEPLDLPLEEFFEKEDLFEPWTAVIRAEYTQTIAAIQEELGSKRFSEVWEEGRRLPFEQLLLQLP